MCKGRGNIFSLDFGSSFPVDGYGALTCTIFTPPSLGWYESINSIWPSCLCRSLCWAFFLPFGQYHSREIYDSGTQNFLELCLFQLNTWGKGEKRVLKHLEMTSSQQKSSCLWEAGTPFSFPDPTLCTHFSLFLHSSRLSRNHWKKCR